MLFRKPVVVAALQSPFLLNRWRQSDAWDFYYELLGDDTGLEEAKELDVPRFKDSLIPDSRVQAVLVTSPLQLENAQKRFPQAWVFWVVHTGFFLEVLPSEHVHKIDGIITLSQRVMDIQFVHKPILHTKNNFVITPWYTARPVWSWKKDTLWTIRSRPASRMKPEKEPFDYTLNAIKKYQRSHNNTPRIYFFGQDAPDGYIDQKRKERFYKKSSAYIGALPVDAGFGMAEHEALAAGVPVVCMRWGDMPVELSPDYSALVGTQEELPLAALRLATDKNYAREMSRLGLEYIAKYRTKESMDRQITSFVRCIRRQPQR